MLPKLYQWYRSTFGHAMLGAALLWAALPPWDLYLWPLAWIAPVWWVLLVRRKDLTGRQLCPQWQPTRFPTWLRRLIRGPIALTRWLLDGRHPYRTLWLAGFLFWMAVLHWLRLPFWATGFLWVLTAFYMGFYLPVFVGLSRVAVHQLRVPVILAAPIVWTGLELARGHLITGTTMGNLGHTQYRWIQLIQISDLAGAYGVSFVVMLVAACLARMVPAQGKPRAIWPLVPAAAVLAAALCYGHFRISPSGDAAPLIRIALIQGSIDSEFKTESKTNEDVREMIHEEYLGLSRDAIAEYGDLDLIVWPETMFRGTLYTYDENARLIDYYRKKGWTEAQVRAALKEEVPETPEEMVDIAEELQVPLLLGVDRYHYGAEGEQSFNSAAFVTRRENRWRLSGCYNKMHLVIFGEYIPFARYFPWVYDLTPLSAEVTPGARPVAFEVNGFRITPNICYESVLPDVIRRQVNGLRKRAKEPDVLVNLTNDGWYWGSSELDMHLICGVFRAVECRKPFLIAANTGISAWIDANGEIVERGPRRATRTILAEVRLDRRDSWYLKHGDWPAGICLAACLVFAVAGCWGRIGRKAVRDAEPGS